jgi:hypothetical protein
VLAQRGRNKQKRHDLRQLGLSLSVTHDFQIPLFHHVYPGNIPDVSLFSQMTGELIDRYKKITGKKSDATLVLDKGNVSDDAMEDLVVSGTQDKKTGLPCLLYHVDHEALQRLSRERLGRTVWRAIVSTGMPGLPQSVCGGGCFQEHEEHRLSALAVKLSLDRPEIARPCFVLRTRFVDQLSGP